MDRSKYSKINNFCLIFLTGFAMTAALIFMKPALVPLVFSFFLYGTVSSLIRWTDARFKVGQTIAMALVFILLAAFAYGSIWIFFKTTAEIFYNIEQYKNDAIALIQTVVEKLTGQRLTDDISVFLEKIRKIPYFTYVGSITTAAFEILVNLFLIFTFLGFFLLGESKSDVRNPLLKNILEKVTTYVSIKLFTSILSGLLVGLLLFVFNIKMYLMFGLVTFLLNFIPTIGSIIASLLPLPFIFYQYGLGWPSFFMVGGMGVIHLSIGYFLDPKIMGENLDLHPVTILVFLIFWGLVWGLPGLFLAVPITSILKIILSRIENTRTISEILSGRLPK